MTAGPRYLDAHWQSLRAGLVEGGATDDQLAALRVCFFCGAHAVFHVLEVEPGDVGLELRREVVAEWQASQHAVH